MLIAKRSPFVCPVAGLLLGILLGVVAFAGPEPNPSRLPDAFPLEKGTYWVYRGETKFLVPKKDATEEERQRGIANEPKSELLTWKMEVVDTLERPNVFLALLKGGPWDLAWYEPGKPRGDHLIVRVGKLRYYRYSGKTAQELWAKAQEGDSLFIPLQLAGGDSGEENLILDLPLAPEKVYGGALSAFMQSRYCWMVEGERPLSKDRFPGAERFPKSVEYTLVYRTSPDYQMLGFATGIGFVSYIYSHHGTLSATDLELIKFGRAPEEGRP